LIAKAKAAIARTIARFVIMDFLPSRGLASSA